MLKHVKRQAPLLVIASIVASPAFASNVPLSFGDGSLVALGTACVVGLVWLVRSKKK